MRWTLGVDADGQPSGGPEYCATVCGALTCIDCSRPQLLPENDGAAKLYAACAGRWYRNKNGDPVGFDYAQVQAVLPMLTLSNPRRAFRGLRVMEAEVLRLRALRAIRE